MLKITDNIKLGKLVGSSGSTSGGGSGGSSNYRDLENKPKINDVELTGNLTGYNLGLIDKVSDRWQSVSSEFGCYDTFDLSGKEGGNMQIYARPNDISLATGGQPFKIFPQTYFDISPTVGAPDSFANASDDTLMTKAQVLEATNGSGGGSSNYNDLTNKPSINDVELSGNKTSVDLGLLDLNTTENQALKSSLNVSKEFALTNDNNQKVFTIQYLQEQQPHGDVVAIAASNVMVIGGANGLIIFNTVTVQNPTSLANLPDNALLTKAQAQEMINNALNNS